QQPLAPQQVDLNALVQSLRDLVRRTTGEAIELVLALEPGTWPTQCDPNQLESALLNLAINARDAMPEGVTLTLRTENITLGPTALGHGEILAGDFVRVTVADTGTGMPPEVIARAFDPFFTTKPLGQGTGLGLSMVYGFARQSGGFAEIHSEAGQGTRVSLLLPRSMGELAEPPMVLPVEDLSSGAGRIIVVVEDDEVVRALAVEALRNLDYIVHEASTGAEGVRLLNLLGPVDLLLSDIGLPGGISGKQLVDAARASRPELKVILITGYAQELLDADLVAQKIALLRKPVLIDVLLRKVQEVVRAAP
ncbi:MAG: response regulator, partial [Comamonadaceae bacterium]